MSELRSIPSLFAIRMTEIGERIVARIRQPDGGWEDMSAHDVLNMVRPLTVGLHHLGIKAGDCVGILCSCRPEWGNVDQAILANGGVTVGIYTTLRPPQIKYIVEHAEIEVAFCEDLAMFERLRTAAPSCLKTIILMEGKAPQDDEGVVSLESLVREGKSVLQDNADAYDDLWQAVSPDDLATLIYTSGTTGPPKGAMLTHRNLCAVVESLRDVLPGDENDMGVVFLPYEHALQRVANYAGLDRKGTGAYVMTLERDALLQAFAEIQPTIQASVPRIWEKFYHAIHTRVARERVTRRGIFRWAINTGLRFEKLREENKSIPMSLQLQHIMAERLVFQRIRQRVFGGRIKYLTSGGAPISVEILEFFRAIGLLILEGYGLTETAAPATLNRPGGYKFGTVGQAIPGVELKIADDGEILIRGPGVMKGYYKNEEATREAIDNDGWFYSGDIGKLDEEGFLTITDRKKNIIVLSTGKNVAPQNIENTIKDSPYISQAMVYGDRRKYITALLTLDPEAITEWASQQGVELPDNHDEWGEQEAVQSLVQQAIQATNERVAQHETIKQWRIIPGDFTVENDMLTPTLKLRRRIILQKFESVIDEMYG